MKVTLSNVLLACLVGGTTTAAAQANPRFINPASLRPTPGYTQVVEVPAGARLVYISGQLPLDKDGKLIGAGDLRRQAEQVFTNLHLALAEVGATFANVVKLNFYVLDVSHVPELREVRDRHVNTAKPPASTLVEVRRLVRDDVLIEVEAVAAVRP
jgi:enamine deaminase RidA (YjgF/YER057c/UK114 family)